MRPFTRKLRELPASEANLSNANLRGAWLGNVLWDDETRWEDVRGLETADNVPDALKQKLGLG